MVRLRPIIVVVSFGLLILTLYFSVFHTKALHATLGGEALLLEIADTEALRERGLSGHRPLALNEGMLFVFPADGQYRFWMKDMLFPIDIIWLDENKRIVDVKERATPSTYPEMFTSHTLARFVLELRAGFFSDHHLKIGNILEMGK